MSMRHRHYPDPEEEHFLECPRNDERSGCLVTSSKERKGGRGPNVLMAHVPEKDRAVITPLNKDAWIVDPMKKNVSSTITCLLKAYYPGVFRPLDEHGRQVPEKDAVVIAHYHNYPAVTRRTILAEFLKRFKFAAGREEECTVLFDCKAVERFSQALSHEKFQAKRALVKSMKEKHDANKSQQVSDGFVEEHTDAANSEGGVLSHLDDSGAHDFDGDDPQLWKAFPPSWIEKKWWDKLCDLWSDESVKKVSAQNSKNRKEGGGVHHTCGSRSVPMHKEALRIENGGEDVDDLEVFARTHRHEKGKGQYASKKAEKLVDDFNKRVKESGNTQVDKQKVWVQLTQGRKRGRYYGLPGIIDKDLANHSSTPTLNNEMQPLYTQQQVQDIVRQAVTTAVRDVREELGTRIQSLEQIVDKPNTELRADVVGEPPSSAVPEFLQALTMDGFDRLEEQPRQPERSHQSDDLWDF